MKTLFIGLSLLIMNAATGFNAVEIPAKAAPPGAIAPMGIHPLGVSRAADGRARDNRDYLCKIQTSLAWLKKDRDRDTSQCWAVPKNLDNIYTWCQEKSDEYVLKTYPTSLHYVLVQISDLPCGEDWVP